MYATVPGSESLVYRAGNPQTRPPVARVTAVLPSGADDSNDVRATGCVWAPKNARPAAAQASIAVVCTTTV